MGLYKIYKYTSPSGGVYIGQTNNDILKRAGKNGCMYLTRNKETGEYYQSAIAQAILKYGWDSFQKEILYSGLTSEEADEKERELIKEYKEKGICYNICSGGKGVPGAREHKVRQYSLAGEYIKTWDSIKEACETLYNNSRTVGDIVRCCKGISKRAYGYIWKYDEDETPVQPVTPYRDPISQYTKEGEYIATFKTIRAASIETGIGETNIGNNLRGRSKSAGGFVWKFASLA